MWDLKYNYYLSVKATLNRCVFRTDFKTFKRRRISNICQQPIPRSGGSTLNEQLPYNLSQDKGTCNSI